MDGPAKWPSIRDVHVAQPLLRLFRGLLVGQLLLLRVLLLLERLHHRDRILLVLLPLGLRLLLLLLRGVLRAVLLGRRVGDVPVRHQPGQELLGPCALGGGAGVVAHTLR